MLNIPDTVKALFKADGIRKNFRVHFPNGELNDLTNADLVQESVKFTESLCSQDVLKFGLTEASVIEFETVGVANMFGMTIECGIEIDLSSLSPADLADIAAGSWDGTYVALADSDLGYAFFRVPYGVFTVDRCPRNHEVMTHRKVTAYGSTFSNLSSAMPMLPSVLPASAIYIDPMAFVAQADRTLLTEVSSSEIAQAATTAELYNSTGEMYELTINGASAKNRNYSAARIIDFLEVTGAYDEEAGTTFGNAVADHLTDLGYDLTYDADKKKIYQSNRDALKYTMPYIFGPALFAWPVYDSGSGIVYGHIPVYSYVMERGKLYPVVNQSSIPQNIASFRADVSARSANPNPLSSIFTTVLMRTSATSNLYFQLKRGTTPIIDFEFPAPMPDYSNAVLKGYRLANHSPYKIKIEKTGSLPDLKQYYQLNTLRKTKQYSYENAFDREGQANGALEINAAFGKSGRDGVLSVVHLDNSEPESIVPGEYSLLWWDEFDVNPIGTVTYNVKAKNETQVIGYQFGSGGSVYDMTDNEALKAADVESTDEIDTIIDASFAPYSDDVIFTPIDMDAKGLPYLEAGDAITLTAEDGTVVDSYIMRMEISGIQVLMPSIESTSGSIIESEVTP